MSTAEAIEWLGYACGDLGSAKTLLGSPRPARNVAFHAQQSIEKALKAVLFLTDTPPPRIHDLDRLRDLLPPGWRVKTKHPNLDRLTWHAVDARYPDDYRHVTKLEASNAIRTAESVFRSIMDDFRKRGIDTSSVTCH
jgi:HEPN domain-containing protein